MDTPATLGQSDADEEIVRVLGGYFSEAKENRAGGMNPRDRTWHNNLDLYYGRLDFSDKADWQATEVLPEVASFVDRFAAAMKEAVVATPDSFYTITDPYDLNGDLTWAVKRATDVWLSGCGRNQSGQLLGFPAVFEEQMKMGALMACCTTTSWKKDKPFGRVAVETVDPRFVWFDHTYRNQYRIRRTEIDRHELPELINEKSRNGKPLFSQEALAQLVQRMEDTSVVNRERTGEGDEITSTRDIVTLDEYIATVVGPDGKVLHKDELFIVANETYLIRGPEKNPYLHGKDWITYAPLITMPLSVYGRTYTEDFGSLARVFSELTNLILDAAKAASINAFTVIPSMLADPMQLAGGISPNMIININEGMRRDDVIGALALGKLDANAMNFWSLLKNELTEAAKQNEIGLGGFAPNSRTSATEISATSQSSSAVMRSIAQTVETRFLSPQLDLIWKTGVQHMSPNDTQLRQAVGPEMFDVMYARRKDFIKHPFSFKAQGISAMIQKSHLLNNLLQLMQIISSNPELLAAFMQTIDIGLFMNLLFSLSNIDIHKISITRRQQMIQEAVGPIQQRMAAEGQQAPSAPAIAEMGDVAQRMGIAR